MGYAELLFDLAKLRDKKGEMESNGYIFIEDALPAEYCEELVSFIDSHLDEQGGEFERGHMGTMQRIWYAEKYANVAQDYKTKCSRILSEIFGESLIPKKILAMRDKHIEFKTQDEFDRFSKGRWHYDSWNDQYKIFLFLRDIGPSNGPFEFIPGTNGRFKKRLALIKPWWFFNPFTHFISDERPYQSISDDKVQTIIDGGRPSVRLVVNQGSMLIVNPSALLHRASPILEGCRYLSVAYF